MNKRILLASLLVSGTAISAPVDEGQVVTLVAGDPARAADLNQTTQALITAINDNAAQIKALNEQLSVIASVINLPQPTLAQELAGSQFKIRTLQSKNGKLQNRVGNSESVNFRHSIFGETGTLTLNADNSSSYVFSGMEYEGNVYLNMLYDPETPSNPIGVFGADVPQGAFPDNDTLPGTWSLSGNQLTVNMDGEANIFWVSMDGNAIMAGDNETSTESGYDYAEASVLTGVRIFKPTPNINVRVDSFTIGSLFSNPANNGAAELVNDTNTKIIRIQNTGTGDLVLGSSAIVQDAGGDFALEAQNGSVTIAPGQEHTLNLDNPLTQGSTRKDAAVYLMTNDPDTPTFIWNIYSTNNP